MSSEQLSSISTAVAGWSSVSRTHAGNVRKVNEDAVLSCPEQGLWVVADGMGGHAAGDVASQMLVENLSSNMSSIDSLSRFVDNTEDVILQVHQAIREHSQREFGGKTMGCTVVSLLARGAVGVCMWAGDSRLYRLRGEQLTTISSDHSQVNEMVEKGLLKPEEARTHPRSNIITRAVGALPKLYLDITIIDIQPGDLYLLCSDGLYGEMEDEALREELIRSDSLNSVADQLVSVVLEGRAKDNLSVVLAQAPSFDEFDG